MSRLDSVIRRLEAQRACLDLAAGLVADVAGPVMELGLGNGRTYDHLRSIMPERDVFVFDRVIAAHPSCIPDARHMIVGEIRETLEFCGPRIGSQAALIHSDLGQGDETLDLSIRSWLSPLVAEHLATGGVVAANHALDLPDCTAVALPKGVQSGRYFLYRRG